MRCPGRAAVARPSIMSVFPGLSWSAAGTLLTTIVGAELVDEEWHADRAKQTARGTDSILTRAVMCERGVIDLRHDPR